MVQSGNTNKVDHSIEKPVQMGSKKSAQIEWKVLFFATFSIIAIFSCYTFAVANNNNIFGEWFDAIISRPITDRSISRKLTPNEFGDSFGALNTFFSGFAFLFIALSFNLQIKEIEEQRKEAKSNAIVDLYQTYTADYFRQATIDAWNVLENCVQCKEYSDFVVSTNFVTEYKTHRIEPELVKTLIQKGMYKCDHHLVKFSESEDRHRLLDVMNFFNILSLRYNVEQEYVKEVFDRCDFFYDWWRPLLWWHSDEIDKKYEKLDPSLKELIIEPKWRGMLERLDVLYRFPESNPEKRLEAFKIHPLIQSMGLDEKHVLSLPESN